MRIEISGASLLEIEEICNYWQKKGKKTTLDIETAMLYVLE